MPYFVSYSVRYFVDHMSAASFKHSLLSVDVAVCMWVGCVCVCVRIFEAINNSETKENNGLFSVGRL